MKNNSNRRLFLKNLGATGLGASILPGVLFTQKVKAQNSAELENKEPKEYIFRKKKREYNAPYFGELLGKIAYPIGGMGAGMFCLEGTGSISHMSIRHRPELYHTPNMFAAIAVKGIEKLQECDKICRTCKQAIKQLLGELKNITILLKLTNFNAANS